MQHVTTYIRSSLIYEVCYVWQTPPDVLHVVTLGLWVHFLKAIMWGYRETLRRYDGQCGLPAKLLPETAISRVFDKVKTRLREVNAVETLFTLSEYVATVAQSMRPKDGKKNSDRKLTGAEHDLLMLVMLLYTCNTVICVCYGLYAIVPYILYVLYAIVPYMQKCNVFMYTDMNLIGRVVQTFIFVLKDLIRDEVALVNEKKNSCPSAADLPDLEDPSEVYMALLATFLNWFSTIRQCFVSARRLFDAADRICKALQGWKTIFPSKTGYNPTSELRIYAY